jgi:adenylate kinase family enzyme
VHLDVLFWREGWVEAPRREAMRELAAVIATPRWILDGNFLADEDGRFARADTVIFLDVSRATCIWRVLKPLVRDRGLSRADLPEGCSEGLDLPLLRWVWRYPAVERPRVLRIPACLDERIAVHHLRTRADVQRFLAAL